LVLTQSDVRRVNFGYFVRPGEETDSGLPRVEPVLGYLVRQPSGYFLFDTGIGGGYEDLDAHYRPVRRSLESALGAFGVTLEDVRWATNCHLHFDHSGGNPQLKGRPIFVQQSELEWARGREDYTLPELIDHDITYESVSGDVELFPGLHLVPTPGHVQGHQSLIIRCTDGTVICAGQSHDNASMFGSDALAYEAHLDGLAEPLPPVSEWMETLLSFDPARVVFAHDFSVWEPASPAA
jgi:N-acyl homoserine lactone hydrolase